jgi:uncharacterized protein YecT (DUF1311 family)
LLLRGLPVAVVAHVLLAVALAWGVQWKRQPDPQAVIPLPPVTATAPSTATMGAGPAPASPPQVQAPAPVPAPAAQAPARPAPPPAQVVARNTVPAPAPAPAPASDRVSPSFDCDKARSTPERIICADADLSRQDRELGRLYARAREASPDPAAFRRRSDARWADRERQCRDRDCLLRWYADRRQELAADIEQGGRR